MICLNGFSRREAEENLDEVIFGWSVARTEFGGGDRSRNPVGVFTCVALIFINSYFHCNFLPPVVIDVHHLLKLSHFSFFLFLLDFKGSKLWPPFLCVKILLLSTSRASTTSLSSQQSASLILSGASLRFFFIIFCLN